MTNYYQECLPLSEAKFQRMVGLKKRQFQFLLELLQEYVNTHWDKRGKPGDFTLEDKLLLTFRYLRSHPTFFELGHEFSISESYAQKIFTRVSESLVRILKLPNLTTLEEHLTQTGKTLETIIIDVSEQETERPKKNNKLNSPVRRKGILKKP